MIKIVLLCQLIVIVIMVLWHGMMTIGLGVVVIRILVRIMVLVVLV